MKVVRRLEERDIPALEAFLDAHADSSMFLRANLARAGLVDAGEVYQACYAASLHDAAVTAVAAHAWNGLLLLQAPQNLAAVLWLAVAASGRKVAGFSGPLDQVETARSLLGLHDAACIHDQKETLYALDVDATVVPDALASGALRCRRPRASELDILANWRADYEVEALGAPDSAEERRGARRQVERIHQEGRHWVLERRGQLVAYSAFNAVTPERVQIGGVWTPPAWRGRGYARAVVAGALLAARDAGQRRAVLFAADPAAKRAYEALGFARIGDYGLVMLQQPQEVGGQAPRAVNRTPVVASPRLAGLSAIAPAYAGR